MSKIIAGVSFDCKKDVDKFGENDRVVRLNALKPDTLFLSLELTEGEDDTINLEFSVCDLLSQLGIALMEAEEV